jgi:predicted nucleotidyltransferase
MDLPDDFRDMLTCLCDAGAQFVVVGGYAVAFHGHPRATKDLDVLVRADAENAHRVYKALADFGAPIDAFDVKVDDFAGYDGVLQIGVPPLRIDILTSITGISFATAIENAPQIEVDGRHVPIIGLDALLANKRAAGREQDLADAAILAGIAGKRRVPRDP